MSAPVMADPPPYVGRCIRAWVMLRCLRRCLWNPESSLSASAPGAGGIGVVMLDDLGKLLRYFESEGDLGFLYGIVGLTFALLALFLVARLIRNITAHRVRQVEEFGMDFDSVASMLDRGLLTDEEARKVKSVLSRHFAQLYEKKEKAQPIDLIAEAERAEAGLAGGSRAGKAPREGQAITGDRGPVSTAAAPGPGGRKKEEAAAGPEGGGSVPLDVLDMHRAGMITDEELEALRRFYAAKSDASRSS